jgi:hypothetical protein
MINTVKTAASVGRSAVVQAINTSTLT